MSEKAVEAKYMVAKILFEQLKYKNSLDTCLKLKNKYSSYEYWIAKTFILIADNYYAQGNSFQAKATLESIKHHEQVYFQVFCILVYLSTDVMHLYIARVFTGVSTGGMFVLVSHFIADISENQ